MNQASTAPRESSQTGISGSSSPGLANVPVAKTDWKMKLLHAKTPTRARQKPSTGPICAEAYVMLGVLTRMAAIWYWACWYCAFCPLQLIRCGLPCGRPHRCDGRGNPNRLRQVIRCGQFTWLLRPVAVLPLNRSPTTTRSSDSTRSRGPHPTFRQKTQLRP